MVLYLVHLFDAVSIVCQHTVLNFSQFIGIFLIELINGTIFQVDSSDFIMRIFFGNNFRDFINIKRIKQDLLFRLILGLRNLILTQIHKAMIETLKALFDFHLSDVEYEQIVSPFPDEILPGVDFVFRCGHESEQLNKIALF